MVFTRLVGGMLDELGYEVVRTATAAAALGALANGRRVDLVLSDFMMPCGMNGLELADAIRGRRAGLPVLLTSGFAPARRRPGRAAWPATNQTSLLPNGQAEN